MVKLLATLLLAGAALQGPGATETAPEPVSVPIYPNTTCPIMGKPISTRLWVDTSKGRIWICCKGCNKEILADVESAHGAAYPVVTKLEAKTCPRTGEPISEDAPTVVLQGYEVPLCCAACADGLRREAQVALARLLDPGLVDLRNPLCPVTGEAVDANAFCVVDGAIVRLSGPFQVERVKDAPRETLARARGIVQEHGTLPRVACPEREARERAAESADGTGSDR